MPTFGISKHSRKNVFPFLRLCSKELAVTLRVRLHVTEMKSHPGIKKYLFTREFHFRMKRVEFHPRMKFNLKENIPLSMKTCNKIYHFSLIC